MNCGIYFKATIYDMHRTSEIRNDKSRTKKVFGVSGQDRARHSSKCAAGRNDRTMARYNFTRFERHSSYDSTFFLY